MKSPVVPCSQWCAMLRYQPRAGFHLVDGADHQQWSHNIMKCIRSVRAAARVDIQIRDPGLGRLLSNQCRRHVFSMSTRPPIREMDIPNNLPNLQRILAINAPK